MRNACPEAEDGRGGAGLCGIPAGDGGAAAGGAAAAGKAAVYVLAVAAQACDEERRAGAAAEVSGAAGKTVRVFAAYGSDTGKCRGARCPWREDRATE